MGKKEKGLLQIVLEFLCQIVALWMSWSETSNTLNSFSCDLGDSESAFLLEFEPTVNHSKAETI